jgi:hypothetical protein
MLVSMNRIIELNEFFQKYWCSHLQGVSLIQTLSKLVFTLVTFKNPTTTTYLNISQCKWFYLNISLTKDI